MLDWLRIVEHGAAGRRGGDTVALCVEHSVF